jgi:hypothetical protein
MIKAHIYWVKGDIPKGWEEVNKAVELDPTDARYLHFRGTSTNSSKIISINNIYYDASLL